MTMKGLIQKEWIVLKWGVISLVLLNIIVVTAGPALINRTIDLSATYFETSLIITGIWFVAILFVNVGMLLSSLETEMKQPDIWLHSPAPIWKLVGSKAVFAVIVTIILLLINGLPLSISFLLMETSGEVSIVDGALSLLSVIISIFLKSIYVMAFGFMLWAFYKVGRSQSAILSIVTTIVLLFVGIYSGIAISELFKSSKFFSAIKEFGPVKLTNTSFYDEHNSYFFMGIVPDGVVFTIGSLLLYGIVVIIFFAAGAKLFEKKVRY